MHLHAGLRGQATGGDRDDKRLWNPKIQRGKLDRTSSTNRNVHNIVYKFMSFKYNSNLFLSITVFLLTQFAWFGPERVQCLLVIHIHWLPWLAEFCIRITSPNIKALLDQAINMGTLGR